MKRNRIAIMIYGESGSGRNALTEEKYKDLAVEFLVQGFEVKSVLYQDELWEKLRKELTEFDAILVWVNPIEQEHDRNKLDELLRQISKTGVFVSTHPNVILKMGTKEVLYDTRHLTWSGDVDIYRSPEDFTSRFPKKLIESKTRVLKQYRGNGGNGVYKITWNTEIASVSVIHAVEGDRVQKMSWIEFFNSFNPYFESGGMLIDQEWNTHLMNGMVRCYVSGTNVAGFGYQEINALYETDQGVFVPTGKRYYFTERCGLFRDLKEEMEKEWIMQLQEKFSIESNMMPVIWDADFFINDINSLTAANKYQLCEINVSCVSPFPPSAVKFIVEDVRNKLA